ncbi:DUF805 domain-containing protein [Neptuniibacter sp. 2_MG-2023]|uniref:DUF805 domain-containing protein n=1 Tax=Neptuniibacter sp. 2_MG-2023 TaxID=3062671 RepID=UPI0026E1F943|nr:DUF805 domain-containing protein [Neptuniibacter sp. 2_MG-2023]MDO6513735.1 DUF805 domain-containing protein [Neptuniibacter sp. 2_MG-2023]
MKSLFSFKGTACRKEFLLAVIVLAAIAYLVSYLRESIYPLPETGIVQYALIKNLLALIYLTLLQPIIVRRLRDIKLSAWWVLLFWLTLPINVVNLLALQQIFGIQIDLANVPTGWGLLVNSLYLLAICTVILSIMLFVVPSRHNKKSHPTHTARLL